MLSTDLKIKAKGKAGCKACNGEGTYVFMECRIFCESCHGEDGVDALWRSIDSILSKH